MIGLNKWLLGAMVLGFILMFGIWQVQVANLRADVATARAETDVAKATARADLEKVNALVSQNLAKNEAIRAEEAEDQLAKQQQLEADNAGLRVAYNEAKQQRDEDSAKLTEILNHAQKDQDSRLDARTRAYYGSLRERQCDEDRSRCDPATP